MEEKILKAIKEVNEEILAYKGNNLYGDGLLDSFQVISLVAELENVFDIEIDPDLIIMENFANKDAIIRFVEKAMGKRDGK